MNDLEYVLTKSADTIDEKNNLKRSLQQLSDPSEKQSETIREGSNVLVEPISSNGFKRAEARRILKPRSGAWSSLRGKLKLSFIFLVLI